MFFNLSPRRPSNVIDPPSNNLNLEISIPFCRAESLHPKLKTCVVFLILKIFQTNTFWSFNFTTFFGGWLTYFWGLKRQKTFANSFENGAENTILTLLLKMKTSYKSSFIFWKNLGFFIQRNNTLKASFFDGGYGSGQLEVTLKLALKFQVNGGTRTLRYFLASLLLCEFDHAEICILLAGPWEHCLGFLRHFSKTSLL